MNITEYKLHTEEKDPLLIYYINENKGEKMQKFCHFSLKHLSSNVAVAIISGCNGMQIRRFRQYREILEQLQQTFKDVTKTDKKFSPVGWIKDMATANFNGLQLFYGENILHNIKGCEFHFRQ